MFYRGTINSIPNRYRCLGFPSRKQPLIVVGSGSDWNIPNDPTETYSEIGLTLGQTYSGNLTNSDPTWTRTGSSGSFYYKDFYLIGNHWHGQQLICEQRSAPSYIDTFLYFLNPDNNANLANDDDNAGNGDSRISFSDNSGIFGASVGSRYSYYRIRATTYSQNRTGPLQMTFTTRYYTHNGVFSRQNKFLLAGARANNSVTIDFSSGTGTITVKNIQTGNTILSGSSVTFTTAANTRYSIELSGSGSYTLRTNLGGLIPYENVVRESINLGTITITANDLCRCFTSSIAINVSNNYPGLIYYLGHFNNSKSLTVINSYSGGGSEIDVLFQLVDCFNGIQQKQQFYSNQGTRTFTDTLTANTDYALIIRDFNNAGSNKTGSFDILIT